MSGQNLNLVSYLVHVFTQEHEKLPYHKYKYRCLNNISYSISCNVILSILSTEDLTKTYLGGSVIFRRKI